MNKAYKQYDFIVIGSGIGGGACLAEIADTGASILMVERGNVLKREKENWDAQELFVNRRYSCDDVFLDKNNKPFTPRMYYYVGGNSKVFGGSAYRFREEDFIGRKNVPSWPFTYKDMEPFYDMAENYMHVCGKRGEDPTEPKRKEYTYAHREHEPYIEELAKKLSHKGLHPFHLPIAVNTDICRKGSACDGYPCRIGAKNDAEISFVKPVLAKYDNVEFWKDAYVQQLESERRQNKDFVKSVLVKKEGKYITARGKTIVLAAGAINSALLLLRSRSSCSSHELANSSNQVGRNYMTHINSVIMAVDIFKKNPTKFQKTLAINDYYLQESNSGFRMGSIQTRGKIKPANLQSHKNIFIRAMRNFISSHSVDFWVMTEDIPEAENRVFYDNKGVVHLVKNYTNLKTHKEMVRTFSKILKKIGYTFLYNNIRTVNAVQHQCGTIRCGNDPKKFPLNIWCQSFDVPNLYVVDASVFPSSAALNPALTVAANALRVGRHLKEQYEVNHIC